MVDVKSYSCFPTMIYEFKGIDKANHLKMLNIVDFENENNNNEHSVKQIILCRRSLMLLHFFVMIFL